MKTLAISCTALALILLFWACLLVLAVTHQASDVAAAVGPSQLTVAWSDWIKTFAAVWAAVIATRALSVWRRQARTKDKIEFLDSLTDAVHAYIDGLSGPIAMVRYIRIAIDSHSVGTTPEERIQGAVLYITADKGEDSKKFLEYLGKCAPSLAKIRSLIAKGQVFGIAEYETCRGTCGELVSYHDSMLALCHTVGRTSANWAHPQTLRLLRKVIELDADEINEGIEKKSAAFLGFTKRTYSEAYR